ncbi:hypothetical protein D9M70_559170 [compost metagenome]
MQAQPVVGAAVVVVGTQFIIAQQAGTWIEAEQSFGSEGGAHVQPTANLHIAYLVIAEELAHRHAVVLERGARKLAVEVGRSAG